jgi:ABC-type transport system involved in multi-copper enzyme maturation permease subunit
MIRALVKKDLTRHARELVFLVAFEVILVLTLAVQLPHLSPSILLTLAFAVSFVAGFVFSLRTVASEDASTGMGFLLSLPVTRGQIVVAKFIVNWLLVVANFTLVWGGVAAYCAMDGGDWPTLTAAITLGALQLLNASFYLSCALLFNSSRAIWIPFPLLIIAINAAVNWQRIAPLLPSAPALPGLTATLFMLACVVLLLVTRHVFGRTAMRHEWA